MKKKDNKILIATSSFNSYKNKDLNKSLNSLNVVFNPFKKKLNKIELKKIIINNNIKYIIAGLEEYDSEIINSTNIKIISRLGSGISNIDQKEARLKNIKVFSTPKGPIEAVSELTLSMMITMIRDVYDMNNNMHKNYWHREQGNLLSGKTVLIIGYGRIGKHLKKLLSNFNVNVIICDKVKRKNKNLKYMSLKKALPKSDIITFHTNTEKEIMGKDEFRLLKKGVIICNSSRGSVINEKEIIKYVKNKVIKKIWLDVFNDEPYSGQMSKYKNIILTPHIGSFTRETRQKMEIQDLKNITENF